VRVLQGREISGPLQRRQAVPTRLYSKQQLFSRTLGHLSAVYCLLFDRSGHYVITVSVHATARPASAAFKNVQVVTCTFLNTVQVTGPGFVLTGVGKSMKSESVP
jgi:hypothetical protein